MKNNDKISFPFELKEGRTVPGLKGVKWIKGPKAEIGSELMLIECFKTDVYYDEPPYMNEIPKKYREKIVCAAITPEDRETVEEFLSERGDTVFYPVGICSQELYDSYMKDVNRYPNAFLINEEGRLLWQGNPFELNDEPNLKNFVKPEYRKKIMDAADLRDRLFSLDLLGAGGKYAGNPHKDEIRAHAKDCYKTFDRDEDLRILICNYDHLMYGEDAPDLGKIKWVQGKSEWGGKYTVITAIDCAEEYGTRISVETDRILAAFGEKISLFGISRNSADEVSQFLESRSEEIKYPVGTVSEKVYKAYVTDNTLLGESGCFLISPEKKFLWYGNASEAFSILNGLLNSSLKEKDIEEFAGERDLFERLRIDLLNYKTLYNSENLKKLKDWGRKILKTVPNCMEVINFLLRSSASADYEEFRKICTELSTSSFSIQDYKVLLDEADKNGEGLFPYEAAPRWMSEMISLDPESADSYVYCSFYLENLHLPDKALSLAEKAVKINPDLKDELNEKISRLHRIIKAGQKSLEWIRS